MVDNDRAGNDWAWLTGRHGPAPDDSTVPDSTVLDNAVAAHGPQVLRTMIERCDTAAAVVSGANGIAVIDPMEIAQSVGEVATMLVAAGVELETDADPGVVIIATRLRLLGRRCQRVACPFVRGETGPEQRDQAWRALQDVTEVLRELLDHPDAVNGRSTHSGSVHGGSVHGGGYRRDHG